MAVRLGSFLRALNKVACVLVGLLAAPVSSVTAQEVDQPFAPVADTPTSRFRGRSKTARS
jgi:hypothetical protein